MTELAIVLFGLLMALVVGQSLLVLGFVFALRRTPPPLVDDQHAPRAAVILCLRGSDPFLANCLEGLFQQDYPNYDIRIVVDHADDPARPIVASAIEAHGAQNVVVEILQEKRASCSLKCSSLLQVVESLDDSYEFVAQLDADTIAHPTWLRELATALADDEVGVATGNRWYMPVRRSIGALVRYTWNAAAIVQMFWYRVPWGGTLAIKTRVFRETDLLEKLGLAFCEDTMLFAVPKRIGLRVVFVPSLMMINREDCDLGGFFRWVRRQLFNARLYHPAWSLVIGHGVVSTLVPAAALLTLFTGDPTAARWSAAGLGLYAISVVVLLWPMEAAVRKIAAARGETTRWLPPVGWLKCLAIMPLTQVIYPAALASAALVRRVSWRGIHYQVDGPWNIQMEQYHPYLEEAQAETSQSL